MEPNGSTHQKMQPKIHSKFHYSIPDTARSEELRLFLVNLIHIQLLIRICEELKFIMVSILISREELHGSVAVKVIWRVFISNLARLVHVDDHLRGKRKMEDIDYFKVIEMEGD